MQALNVCFVCLAWQNLLQWAQKKTPFEGGHSSTLYGKMTVLSLDVMAGNCCGPEGRRWFSESPGSPRPAAPLGGGGAVSTSDSGRFRGARFLNRAVGPSHAGDRSPGACCVRRVAAQPYGYWLARGETRQWGKERFTMQHARTGQMRMREARSRVPHVTSRQDSMYCCVGIWG